MNIDELEIPIVRESEHEYRLSVGYAEAHPKNTPTPTTHALVVVPGIFCRCLHLFIKQSDKLV